MDKNIIKKYKGGLIKLNYKLNGFSYEQIGIYTKTDNYNIYFKTNTELKVKIRRINITKIKPMEAQELMKIKVIDEKEILNDVSNFDAEYCWHVICKNRQSLDIVKEDIYNKTDFDKNGVVHPELKENEKFVSLHIKILNRKS